MLTKNEFRIAEVRELYNQLTKERDDKEIEAIIKKDSKEQKSLQDSFLYFQHLHPEYLCGQK